MDCSSSRIVSVRVSHDDYRKLADISRKSGDTLSETLRKMICQLDGSLD